MANANAIVEKMKDLGLRHGEKAGVAIASMAFFVCVGMAANQQTIDTTPEQIKQVTQASESNLNRQEKRETIIEKLEQKGIKDSSFSKVVEEQVKTALVADNFKATREWVTTEPGAGLIRDTPVLIAVTELYAYPGRGGLLVYELDSDGNRVPETDKDKVKATPQRRKKRKKAAGGGMGGGMMGGMGGGAKKKKGKSKDELAREAKEEADRQAKVLAGKFAGDTAKSDLEETKEEKAATEAPSKEITKGYRWVVLTGVLDHAKLVANYREALKNPAVAHPNYKRLDLQRQTLQPDGSWTKWENVSIDERYKVLDNLPEIDEELTPDNVRPTNLVDPLPFMKAGLWEKVHIGSLVPKEKKEIAKTEIPRGGMMGGGMMGNSGGGMMGGKMGGMMGGPGSGMMGNPGGGMMGNSGGGMMGGKMGGMMGGAGGGMMGAGSETIADWRSEAKKVMIRAFDFTAKEDETYRYRVRIVVYNPNLGREDVDTSKAVDTKAEELRGPWSEESDAVTMPPDVMPYAAGTFPPSSTSDAKMRFQVIRFNPTSGVTVPHRFEASPGEMIGEPKTADVPVSDGSGKKATTIDFNSRQIVLDVFSNKKTGGYQPLPAGFVGPPIIKPALALVLRPDGSAVLHSEADDEANDVRRDIEVNYKEEIKRSSKERKSGTGMGGMGMMGGGMMGGGMMGGMGGGPR
jgi:hypothetical protein